ncbi:hypothetical protein [Actinoplanes sp. NPDC049802]|uniref:VHL beta domain-containing protein n=1 Tax=Actinoplanes sp. NPDC049802 TaxID=3154742 RepID=UPI0033F6E8AA
MTEKLPDTPEAYQPPDQVPADSSEPPPETTGPYQAYVLPYAPPPTKRTRPELVFAAVLAAILVIGASVVLITQWRSRDEAPSQAAPVAAPAEPTLPAAETPAAPELPELTALPAGAEKEKSSAKAVWDASSIRFLNTTGASVSVQWLDYQQKRVWYADLAPGQSYDQTTYAGHVWVVTRSDGTAIAVYEATAEPGQATIR